MSTSASQEWRDAAFDPNLRTLTELVAYATSNGVSSFMPPQCSSQIWSISGMKQYGPWVASVALYATPATARIDATVGIGDVGRGNVLNTVRARQLLPLPPNNCPAAAANLLP